MRILVCGGNGFIGRHIVNLLALAGHDPVARSRHSLPALDYAKATTELAKSQIIQQAATAMLAQANQQPQSVLSLLR